MFSFLFLFRRYKSEQDNLYHSLCGFQNIFLVIVARFLQESKTTKLTTISNGNTDNIYNNNICVFISLFFLEEKYNTHKSHTKFEHKVNGLIFFSLVLKEKVKVFCKVKREKPLQIKRRQKSIQHTVIQKTPKKRFFFIENIIYFFENKKSNSSTYHIQ